MASGEIVRSRVTAPPDLPIKEKLAKKNFYNVLNKYRSYSYITTMSCLDRVSASQPEVYRTKGDLGNIILKSSGKVPGDKTTKFLPLTTVDGETQKEIDFFNEKVQEDLIYISITLKLKLFLHLKELQAQH